MSGDQSLGLGMGISAFSPILELKVATLGPCRSSAMLICTVNNNISTLKKIISAYKQFTAYFTPHYL